MRDDKRRFYNVEESNRLVMRRLYMNNTVVKRGDKLRYSCIRSGRCCSSGPNVALTVYDICKIAKYLNVNWRDLAGKYIYVVLADYIPVALLRGINNKCIFLKMREKPTCMIYPARPARCRLYPFIPISPTESSELEVSVKCPGVGVGELNDPPWSDLDRYLSEVVDHYTRLHRLIFIDKYEPLRAFEALLDEVCNKN